MNRTIAVENLVKAYPSGQRAVDGISFGVAAGEVFGFLGPNGAGKSTTVRVLATLSLPSSGSVHVGGYDVAQQPAAIRRVIGVALQEIGVDPIMTARELLILHGRLFGLAAPRAQQRAAELLDILGLEAVAKRPAGTYSGGMRRRLDLALALVHEPAILFLDEPTTGLDPASRRDLWAEVSRLNREAGTTIFLTTQYLEEADAVADRIAIMNGGQIVAEGRPAALKAAIGSETIMLEFADAASAERAAARVATFAQRIQRDAQALRLYLPDAARAVPSVVNALGDIGLTPQRLMVARPTLDDVFLHVTGQQFAGTTPTSAASAAL
ncbi:MAG: ATP-binding cassette domain-containing protein [Roseiflexaceae bacterium]|nr:ATP-binding cassette domain-containing protein [Roseiflexaceae bacterium]